MIFSESSFLENVDFILPPKNAYTYIFKKKKIVVKPLVFKFIKIINLNIKNFNYRLNIAQ